MIPEKRFLAALLACAAVLYGCEGVDNDDAGLKDPEEPGIVDPGTASEVGTGEGDGYTLVWADYFNDGTLDREVWNIEVNGEGGGNNELQYYREENVSVGDDGSGNGCLILTAKKESYLGKSFTSGRLNTQGNMFFTHGKIESSIKLPKTANGLWPAFWLLGNDFKNVGWPRCGEVDILEMGNSNGIRTGRQETYFNGACHWGFYKDGAYPNYAKAGNSPYSLQDGEFHLFTMIWDENSIKMYLDRDKYPEVKPYYEMGIDDASGEWSTGRYFHHDFFIVYDLAVGGNFVGIWNADGITALADGPRSMYINFVKVYQK